MPELPALTPQKVINILEKKGFVLSRVKGSHHLFYHPETKCRVVVPVHGRDLPTGTLLEILKQAGVGQEEIEDFYKCRIHSPAKQTSSRNYPRHLWML